MAVHSLVDLQIGQNVILADRTVREERRSDEGIVPSNQAYDHHLCVTTHSVKQRRKGDIQIHSAGPDPRTGELHT